MPTLRNEVWNKIANPAETLCASCLSERMVRMFGRTLRFADLLPCYFNMMHSPHSWFDLFMSAAKRAPANIAEWRAVAQREKYEQAMVEKLGRGIFSAASPAGW